MVATPTRAASPSDGVAYLTEQTAAAREAAARGDRTAFDLAVDKTLSLIATLRTPEVAPLATAAALSQTIGLLAASGEVERAWGLYRASAPGLARALPAGTPHGALHRLFEAELLQQVGDGPGAVAALNAALTGLRNDTIPADLRATMTARALLQKAAISAGLGDLPTARAALQAHPAAAFYAQSGRTPAAYEEIEYLAVRGLVAGLGQTVDPVVAEALQRPLPVQLDPLTLSRVEILRTAGAAMARPPGRERQSKLAELGRRIAAAPRVDPTWRHPGILNQLLVALALTQTDAEPDVAFALFQLAGRSGPVFDADAQAALSLARDETQRRTLHQALRLKARRDRLERGRVHLIAERLTPAPVASGVLSHDPTARLQLREFSVRLDEANAALAKTGLSLTPGLAPLARLQAALAPDEAALAVAPAAGGYAYFCVRRGTTTHSLRSVDPLKLKLDTRLLQAALTATHAADEATDTQFPVEAAVRTYETLVRPFEPCLKPGDRIIWLSSVASAPVPLAALLPAAPPKLGQGYDLAAADWLVRRHAVSYAGSASAVLASRTGAPRRTSDFDFLGVGDPVLSAKPAVGATPGVRIEGLAELPETRAELEASARGFRKTRLLLGEQATERLFRSQVVGAYRYLSFATHGLIRDDLQGLAEPALVLTPVTPADPLDDGLLTANEIADLDLSAVFVALSACNTANFDLAVLAQELPALTSAFAVAGAPSTLATLWPVDSQTGQQVVTGVFERLRGGANPTIALAEAQRAFLARAPGRAYHHPRFWAPFVVLGDGGAPTASAPADVRLASVEVLTRTGGEVIALKPEGAGVAARMIGERNAQNQHAATLRMAAPAGESWRQDTAGGSAKVLATLGGRLVAGGFALGPHGRYAPTLAAHDPASGAPLAAWRGDDLAQVDAFLLAGTVVGEGLVIAVAELNLRDPPAAGGARLHVLRVGADLAPHLLFTTAAPPGTQLTDATLSSLNGQLLFTYSGERPRPSQPEYADLYEQPLCRAPRATWLELRDVTSGAVVTSQELPDVSIMTATARRGDVVLAGASQPPCGESRAVALAADASLKTRPLFSDASLGESAVRAILPLSKGSVLLAAHKGSVVEFEPVGPPPTSVDPYALKPFSPTYAGMLVVLPANGPPAVPTFLEAAANVYVTALARAPNGEILLGGALAGQAAIFHLTEGR